MNNALTWLNRFEPTHLRRTTQAMLRHINDPSIDESKRQQMMDSAIEHSRENTDNLEYPELMLHLAGLHIAWQDAGTALDFVQQACDVLLEGSHYHAVCCWILGVIAYKVGDRWLGFSSWYVARQTFEQLAEKEKQTGNDTNAQWYRDLLVRLNMDLLCKAEEAYTWLDLFDVSRLSNAAEQHIEEISKQLNQDILTETDTQNIAAQIEELLNLGTNSMDPLESAEVLVECAMMYHRLGNLLRAQEMLQKAVEAFPPQSHSQAVALWLLGIFEWQSAARRNTSIQHWEESLRTMDTLEKMYAQEQKPQRVEWYQQKREVMARVLEKRKKTIEK